MRLLNPVNIIKENSAIPIYNYEYFAHKNMSELIDQTFERSCLLKFSESDSLVLSILIEMVKMEK